MSFETVDQCASCGKFAYGQNVETRDEYFELGMKNCQECKDYMKCMYTGIEQLEVVVLSQALIFEGIIAKQINTPEKKRIIGEKLKQELQVKSPSTFTITSITDQTSETSLLQLLDRRHPFSTKQTSVVKIEYEIRIPSSVSSEDISLYREKMQNIMEKDNDNESSQIVDVIAQEANVQVEQIRMAARAPTEKKKMYRENQAEQEVCDAKYSGGLVIDFNRCVEVWEKSAKHGYVDAQINLAKIYRLGSRDGSPMTIPIDQQLAFRWSLAAAKQGDVHCMFRIGVAYYRGRGVERNKKTAFAWFMKAAEIGDQHAQSMIGTFYERGMGGVDVNLALALHWHQQSAAQGFEHASDAVEHLRNIRQQNKVTV